MALSPADRILPAFARFHGWGYPGDGQQPAVPAPSAPTGDPERDHLPGVPRVVRLAPPAPKVVDCSTLTAWVLHAGYPDARAASDGGWWAELQIADHDDLWSPITGTVARGVGVEVDPREWGPGWYLTQSWGDGKGHARIVEVLPDGLRVLESRSTRRQGVGPGVCSRLVGPRAWETWGEVRAARLGSARQSPVVPLRSGHRGACPNGGELGSKPSWAGSIPAVPVPGGPVSVSPTSTALLTALVVAALLALALRGPSWLRAYAWGALGLLGAAAGAAWALLGRRRPGAGAPPRAIDAATEGEARRVERIEATHADAVAEVEGRAELDADERRRLTAGRWR